MGANPFSTALGHVKKIHFIGIGGVGMCGIAEVLLSEGYRITGSDLNQSAITERLQDLGAKVYFHHQKENISDVDVVVVSSAINEKNEEIIAAKAKKIPIIRRAEMLAEIMRFRYGIAVAGTHGKTTTTSLMAHVLAEANFDPSFVIGGKLTQTGTTAKLGESKYLVAEADESDASFLYLKPMQAVITNIDCDHMQTYGQDVGKLEETFLTFLHHLPFYGKAAICIDDLGVKNILSRIERPYITYGFDDDADICAINWQQNGLDSQFEVKRTGKANISLTFSLPGRHNVQNVLAVIASLHALPISDETLIKAIASFKGVGRRFQLLGKFQGEKGQALLIDDYGHHPREIESTIEAVRKVWPDKRLVLAFQPHRYSRTQSLFNDFVTSLSAVDALMLLEVFAAGETELEGCNHLALAKAIQAKTPSLPVYPGKLEEVKTTLAKVIEEGDIVLMQGAGSIGRLANQMKAQVEAL